LLLVTGGPGTGKTTTTARLLVLLAARAALSGQASPRIALAAPTGRAAERMAESVRHATQALAAQGLDADLLAPLPTTGTTLHRLLGTIPDSPRFRHDGEHPLPFDVVVVDEASMIDLPLMTKLVDAVAPGTRLVLLGDPDQLPSVEAGDVLAAILGAAGEGERIEAADADALQPLLGPSRDADIAPASSFAGARVHLQRGWRQSEALALAPLAAAVRAGDADLALSQLRRAALAGVHFHEELADPLEAQRERLLTHFRALGQAATPAEALAQSTRLRLLTAVREGPQGARTLNARIERLLAEASGPVRSTPGGHFHGQLLIVTENSYRHRLFNGDIGLCLRDATGALVAWFPGDTADAPRAFHPAALPAHESAFAMTVHKAQGSEFDTVWLLLPARGNRVLSRELVYTGLTRARRELHVAGSEAVIREALSRHASRWSGLGWRLGAR
jgi:exodeoxyribonuclease V alpha subunit